MTIKYLGEVKGAWRREGNILNTTRILKFHSANAEDAMDIYLQPEIPAFQAPHPRNRTMFCKSVTVPEAKHIKQGIFEVSCEYTDDIQNSGFGELNPTVRGSLPWARPLYGYSCMPVEREIAMTLAYKNGDKFGEPSEPVVNTAGDAFELKDTENILSIKFQYNLQTWNDNWALNYSNTVNSSAVRIAGCDIPAHKALLKSIQATGVTEDKPNGRIDVATGVKEQYYYYQVAVEIHVSPKPWVAKVLNTGYNANFTIKGVTKNLRVYTNDKYNTEPSYKDDPAFLSGSSSPTYSQPRPVDTPVKLDENGKIWPVAQKGGFYSYFYNRFFTSWDVLNLPKNRGDKTTWAKV